MYHIGEALVRWIAPILSFTAEEIWENLPGQRSASVLLELWYDGLQNLSSDDAMGRIFWQRMMAVRTAVNKAMEVQRAAGALRGSLDATVTLYCADELREMLLALGDELRFVLITSAATVLPLSAAGVDVVTTELPELQLQIAPSTDEKCERCWHRTPAVGLIPAHPTLCERCIENVDGEGERRRFA
jgi:isoleucyl-tRNA synthetase